MSSKMLASAASMGLYTMMILSLSLIAQSHDGVRSLHHHYRLVQIPTFGGPGVNFFDNTNNISVLNDRGTVSGGSADTLIADPFSPNYFWSNGNVAKAFVWQTGSLTNLGSLIENVSSGSAWISSNGTVAGLSENGQIDPSSPDLPELSAVMWRDGKITNLGTLPGGGYQSAAVSVNDRGEVAGVATNLVPDVHSMFPFDPNLWGIPYDYQLRAFIWDQKRGMRDLGTLSGSTDAQAIKINERGQVIGNSYTSSDPGVCFDLTSGAFPWDRKHGMVDLGSFGGTCIGALDLNNAGQIVGGALVTGDAYQRAFLWQDGALRDLGGSLGGSNTGAVAVNEKGAAVGFAYLAGETTFHATLWTHVGHMIDLGTVGGDPCSFAQSVNDADQVVGNSTPSDCASFDTSRPFLWEHGSMVDLNTLVPSNSPLQLIYAYTINRRGEIAVNGIDANGIEQAALLIPCDDDHDDIQGCDYDMVNASKEANSPAPRSPRRTQRVPLLRQTTPHRLPGMAGKTTAITGGGSEGPLSSFDQAPTTQTNLTAQWISSDITVATTDGSTGNATCVGEGGPVAVTASAARTGVSVEGLGTLTCTVRPRGARGQCEVNPSTNLLTGCCDGPDPHEPNHCLLTADSLDCSAGLRATSPETVSGCLHPATFTIDTSTACH